MFALLSTLALTAALSAQAYITCSPYTNFGVSQCPYAAATTAQIESTITTYCTGTCVVEGNSVPCKSQPSYTLYDESDSLFVQVGVPYPSAPGGESNSACEENLTAVVTQCNEEYGEYGWLIGTNVEDIAYQVWVCAIGD